MEVKDVTVVPIREPVPQSTAQEIIVKTEDSVAAPLQGNSSTVDTVEVSENFEAKKLNQFRLDTNKVIASANFTSDTTEKIGKLVTSIEGIIQQSSDLPPEARQKLEQEGKTLIREITRLAKDVVAVNPPVVSTDEVRMQIERSLGRALDAIFPTEPKGPLGINDLTLSTKEAIIATRSSIEKAKAQYESLRKSVSDVASTAQALSQQAETLAFSKASSGDKVRSVDDATRLTANTKGAISEAPLVAIQSVGSTDSQLLRQ